MIFEIGERIGKCYFISNHSNIQPVLTFGISRLSETLYMFMAREILRTLWRHSATDDPGPDVKPHIRPGERITQYLSTETEINWNIQIIFCSSRFAFSSGQINSPLIPWFPPHRSSHCVEISSFYCFCGSVLVGDTEVRPCDPVKVKLKIFIVIVMTDQRPGEGWGIFKKWLFIPTKLLEHH